MHDTNSGRFVWYDLMTTDPRAAIAFYTHVVGWKTEVFGDTAPGKAPYHMWVGSQGPLGGIETLPEQAEQMGAPPHWMAHVEVADLDATVAKAQRMDARILVPPTEMPKVGRFSILADPQGATISAFHGNQPMTRHDDTRQGEFAWNELLTTDNAAALHFYGEIFGWKKESEYDMGPMGKYLLYGQNGKWFGGMMSRTKEIVMPNTWLYYIQVDDLDAALARATERGARVLNGPMEVPGGTRIVQLMDPQGAGFALHSGVVKSVAA